MRRLRILVFSATFGAGHFRAAEAIIEGIRNKEPDAEIVHLDFVAFISKTINSVIKKSYIVLIKHSPRLWGEFYTRTSKLQPDSLLLRFINGLGRREFLGYIKKMDPDLIIATHPTIGGVLGQLRAENLLRSAVVTVVTDYALHSSWVHPGVDLYIVGNRDVQEELSKHGIPPAKTRITGIPISPRFERELAKNDIAQALGIRSNLPTLLVMGGAYGVLDGLKEVCENLTGTEKCLQILVVCGRDEKLYRSLEGILAQTRNPAQRFGYVENVEELMAVSDMIITKAGGLTVSEALTKRLPLLIYKPIPGQEDENAQYIEKIGAGRIARSQHELLTIVDHLLNHPEQIQSMKDAASKALPGNAAEKAAEYSLELLK